MLILLKGPLKLPLKTSVGPPNPSLETTKYYTTDCPKITVRHRVTEGEIKRAAGTLWITCVQLNK